jgi:L-threonylcarbamoyladenylate synthase
VIELVIDDGPTTVGVESTVLDLTVSPPLVLRRGGVTCARLLEVLGELRVIDELATEEGSRAAAELRSPGLRHRHYAPRARVVLVARGRVGELVDELAGARSVRVGVMVGVDAARSRWPAGVVVRSMPASPEAYARELFASLRALDDQGVSVIVVEAVPEDGLGASIMDRLRRAAAACGSLHLDHG